MKVYCDRETCSNNDEGECSLSVLSLEKNEMNEVVCLDDDSE